MTSFIRATLGGVAAAAVALGVAEVVAVVSGPRSAPLIAVGGAVVDAVPEPVKHFAISVFGTHDKIALLIGTAVLLAVLAALIGVFAFRNLWYGYAGITLLGAVGVLAALTRPGATWTWALPALLGAGAAAVALTWLASVRPAATEPTTEQLDVAAPGQAERAPEEAGQATPGQVEQAAAGQAAAGRAGEATPGQAASAAPYPQRRFVLRAGILLAGAAVSGFAGRLLSTRRSVAAARQAIVLPPPTSPAPGVPIGANPAIAGITPYQTPNREFYRIDTALVVPQVGPDTWQLRIFGQVRNPITISYADLLARPLVERWITLCCVSNEVGGDLIGNARWVGVPVKDLLDEAEPLDGADQVLSYSVDGFTCGTPTAVLRDGRDALLVVGMNGEPLPIEHGFPVRMVVPGLYGYVSACKWIVGMELTSFADKDAYWVMRGWAPKGPIKTQSRIDVPRGGRVVRAGPVQVAGVAWAQHRGIAKVEVSVDNGAWQPATLARVASIDTWVQWYWTWPAEPGRHTLTVRATDATGQLQPREQTPPFPDGATGWHSITVTVTR